MEATRVTKKTSCGMLSICTPHDLSRNKCSHRRLGHKLSVVRMLRLSAAQQCKGTTRRGHRCSFTSAKPFLDGDGKDVTREGYKECFCVDEFRRSKGRGRMVRENFDRLKGLLGIASRVQQNR